MKTHARGKKRTKQDNTETERRKCDRVKSLQVSKSPSASFLFSQSVNLFLLLLLFIHVLLCHSCCLLFLSKLSSLQKPSCFTLQLLF